MSPILLGIMGFASYRAWRFIGEDEWPPSVWFREELERQAGADSAWVTWITCPWCLGAHISAAVVSITDHLVGLQLPVFQWLAVSCIVGLIGKLDG